jgi:holo-[acyl-carrier protein] synthase
LIGLGVDLVDLDRFATVLERRANFISRVYTPGERDYCEQAKGAVKRVERYAVRFAAKEAVMKALGVGLGDIDFHDVEVVRQEKGAPTLAVRGRAEMVATEQGVTKWLLSLSHTESTAMAVVIALSRAGPDR